MGGSPEPDDFFLPAKDETDDLKFLPPSRPGNMIEPLIDGVAFFVAVEEAIADAKESVYCAFWNIYPNTPLLSKKVMSGLKVKDWQGLLTKASKNNKIKVRIIASDFDAVLNNGHQRAWRGYNSFVRAAVKAGLTRDQFQVFCSRHPASFVASGILNVARILVKRTLQETIDGFNKNKLKGLENSPGIWGLVKLSGKRLKMRDTSSFQVWPGSCHQKTVVIDNRIGFVGGINISSFYHNTPQHLGDHRAHDIFCRVEGPVVEDIERNFVGRWNAESPGFNAFVAAANAAKLGKYKIKAPLTITSLTKSKSALGKQGNAVAQIHRTVSSSMSGSFPSLTLQTDRDDVKKTYEKVISLANDFIYIENQYVRVVQVADWIINRFKANRKLQVIIVVPVLPEELEEGKGDPLTLHGIFLEHETLTRLRADLGANLGLYSLVQKTDAPTDDKNKSLSSFGSLRIYPHSKVLIVDDLFASIGSANVNPRGFELDSELDLGWYEPASVKAFREQLWKEHLGQFNGMLSSATWKAADYVKEWDAIARKNTTVSATSRHGFVVPHDPEAAKGTQQSFPDFLAELGNTGREDSDTQVA